jgi:hypothetical protein
MHGLTEVRQIEMVVAGSPTQRSPSSSAWPTSTCRSKETPSEAKAEAIEAVRACRELAERLTRAASVDV